MAINFIQSDFEYFMARFATLQLSSEGSFFVTHGDSSETPLLPKVRDNAILLATMFIPAYTFQPSHVTIKMERHQRFTMKDIGKLERRLQHVEYYTSLNLLERSAKDLEITEAEYQGKKVKLNDPIRGGSKKFYVYVKNNKGNVIKVSFGDTTGLEIKREDPERRKAFRARHNCDQKKDKTTAGYWSCKFWSGKSVTDLMKG